MSDTDKLFPERGAFEKWYYPRHLSETVEGAIENAWDAWQAATDHLHKRESLALSEEIGVRDVICEQLRRLAPDFIAEGGPIEWATAIVDEAILRSKNRENLIRGLGPIGTNSRKKKCKHGYILTAAPPKHPFEVRISIGGDDWDYVLRVIDELALHLRDHGPDCSLCSGGAGGSHSVHIERRDISAADYHRELEAWFRARKVPA